MAKPLSRRPSKFYRVKLGLMRTPPVLVTQRQFRKAHGDRIAAELDLDKLGVPVLNHRDNIFWILDGQHRIYAMRQFGFAPTDEIDCEVFEGLTDEEAAKMFLGRDARRAICPFDKFHIACTAGQKRELDIRRAVESNGLAISRDKQANRIGAVSALGKVYDRAGDIVVGQVVRTLKNAFEGDPQSFDGALIEGLGHLFNRFNGKTNEKELSARLSHVPLGARGVLRRAEAQREKTGNAKAQCVAAAVVDIYNKGQGTRSGERLPAWWKD